jgi:hypothetical protein
MRTRRLLVVKHRRNRQQSFGIRAQRVHGIESERRVEDRVHLGGGQPIEADMKVGRRANRAADRDRSRGCRGTLPLSPGHAHIGPRRIEELRLPRRCRIWIAQLTIDDNVNVPAEGLGCVLSVDPRSLLWGRARAGSPPQQASSDPFHFYLLSTASRCASARLPRSASSFVWWSAPSGTATGSPR